MNLYYLLLIIFILLFVSCKNTTKPQTNPYDELIQNPMTANKAMDTINIPKLYFSESKYDFGTIQQGDSVIHEFVYYNKGLAKLLITNVSSSCGCTVPKIYKDQLEPGDSSILRVVFHSKDKIGYQEKKTTLFANTFPPETEIVLVGYVNN